MKCGDVGIINITNNYRYISSNLEISNMPK